MLPVDARPQIRHTAQAALLRGLRWACALGMLLSIAHTPLVAQANPPIRDRAHASWNERDGLPQSTISSIAETPDGYIWLGTASGLARFDGVRFQSFDPSNTPALTHGFVQALAVDRDGALWLGTDGGGLLRHDDGRFSRVTVRDGLPHPRIMSLEADPAGGLWIGTYGGGLAHWRDGVITVFDRDDGLPDLSVFALHHNDDGLWIGTLSGGLARLHDGIIHRVLDRARGLPADTVYDLLTDRRGRLWMATTRGLARLDALPATDDDAIALTVYDEADGLAHPILFSLAIDRHDALWIGSYGGGAFRYHDGEFTAFQHDAGLSDNIIRAVFVDTQDHVWIGTGSGLDQLKISPFTTHLDGLTTAFVQDSRGRRWVSTFDGLIELDDDHGVRRRLGRDDGLVDPMIWHAVRGGDGALWIATRTGVQRIDERPEPAFTVADGLPSSTVYFLLPRPDGSLWLATDAGVARLADGRITHRYDADDGLPGNQVRSLLIDPRGRLWIGTTLGLARIDRPLADGAPDVITYTTAEGLLSDNIWALSVGASDDIWVVGRGGGLVRIHEDAGEGVIGHAAGHQGFHLHAVTLEQGLPDTNLCSLHFDDRGVAWLSSARGIVRVDG
ncbi:MAG: two-component regulator propeller domain-containing protein, partial [Acidobacteriota bacterium]